MAASRFVEVSDKEISEIKINSVLKNTKGWCKNTKTIVRLRLSDYRGIFTSYKHTPILYSTNFWHSSKAMFTLYRITLRPTQKPYRIGLLFTYEMLLSSQFLQRTGGAAVRTSKWCAMYRIGFCNALIVM